MQRSTGPAQESDGRAIGPQVRGKVVPMSSPANIESMAGDTDRHTIGLISDTHGLLRPGVHSALDGVELILHAGDVGGDEILHELGAIAPVLAVQGNTDPG